MKKVALFVLHGLPFCTSLWAKIYEISTNIFEKKIMFKKSSNKKILIT
jgi:hypothetical protein